MFAGVMKTKLMPATELQSAAHLSMIGCSDL
jgi:hypothetical protein